MLKKTSRLARLAQKEEGETIKRVVFFSFLSLILAILLFTFGIPFLGKFADFLNLFFKGKETISDTVKFTPTSPRIDPLPSATNSAMLAVFGFAEDGTKVLIYQDLQLVEEIEVINGKFKFEGLVLKDGQNKISAKSQRDSSESNFSDTEIVVLDVKEPELQVETPQDGQAFSQDNRIRVSGNAEANAQVYANGFLASVNYDGRFEVFVPVTEGETTIEIKAIDEAGNTKVETRKINYKP